MSAPFRLDQLDEEVRIALGLTRRPGLVADPSPRFADSETWMALIDSQRSSFAATVDAHAANPLWGEKADESAIRLALSDTEFNDYLAKTLPTTAETIAVVKKLLQLVRAFARIIRS